MSKDRYAKENWYDVWYPELSPSPDLMAQGKSSASESEWNVFVRKFRKELTAPTASRTLDLLAALSHQTNFSIGCYCEKEDRCHRSVLRAVFKDRGASII